MYRFYQRNAVEVLRFYTDGRQTWLLPERAPTRELDLKLLAPSSASSYRTRVFLRRDYGYGEGFIGPHRDSDYHEEP